MTKRKSFSSTFKAKVAIEALQEKNTIAELSAKHRTHSTQIKQWRQQLEKNALDLFSMKGNRHKKDEQSKLVDKLYQRIGELEFAHSVLKKKLED